VFFVTEVMHDVAAATMAQAAVTDIDEDRFVGRQLESAGRPQQISGRFELEVGENSARGGGGRDRLTSVVEGYEVALDVQALQGVTAHYGGRDHRYAFGGDTCYYSRPLMDGTGTITTPDGMVHEVSGRLWFDRQWGELIPAVMIGWQWFAIQLGDDLQIMLFAFNNERDEWTGTITRRGGRATPLGSQDFAIEILDWWTSPHTGHDYPHSWKVSVAGEQLHIQPLVADQEMTSGFWIGPQYWEGACSVTGSRTGSAYVELTGFGAERIAGWSTSSEEHGRAIDKGADALIELNNISGGRWSPS
jgi:predicted secreted hydrolase